MLSYRKTSVLFVVPLFNLITLLHYWSLIEINVCIETVNVLTINSYLIN